MKVHYNSPLILNFSFICIAITLINLITRTNGYNGLLDPMTTLSGHFKFTSFHQYLAIFFYPFNHASIAHLFGNLGFILLLGPMLEEKYGRQKLAQAMVITIFSTAILNIWLFDSGIIGASGLVFLFIILSSFTNVSRRGIPLTFILVFLIYVGKEVYAGFFDDQISQFGHIMGGIVGAVYGFTFHHNVNK